VPISSPTTVQQTIKSRKKTQNKFEVALLVKTLPGKCKKGKLLKGKSALWLFSAYTKKAVIFLLPFVVH